MNASCAHEVWVTGIGAVTPLGAAAGGAGEALRQLLRGACGTVADPAFGGRVVGRCTALAPDREARRLDRTARLFVAAAEEAWRDAGAADADFDTRRIAVLEGSSLGPMADLLAARPARARRPTDLVRFMSGAGGAAFAARHGLRGPVLHVSAGSVSSAAAIGEAFARIRDGHADVVVAGGSECPLEPSIVETFGAAGVLAAPGEPCRPFDAGRGGVALAEGAGAMVLESAAHARARGARPYAEIVGYGFATSCTAMAAPDPDGADVSDATVAALAGCGVSDLGWIKAHGTGTRANDAAECRGLARALGPRFATTPMSSLKAALGHSLGASGATEAVLAVLALGAGVAPGIATWRTHDPALAPANVATEARPLRGDTALLLSQSFGGRALALAVRRVAMA